MSQLPADRDSLQVLLARIHERLNEAGSLDAGTRQLLGQVMGDIERALAQDAPVENSGTTPAVGATAAGSRVTATEPTSDDTSRLEALAVRFEAEHPSLAATLRRLVDLLSEVGI